jgi:anti-anti-sigma factor
VTDARGGRPLEPVGSVDEGGDDVSDDDATFDVEVLVSAASTVLALRGELDVFSAPLLDARLRDVRPLRSPLVIDVAGLSFIDSSGLRSLTTLRRAAVEDVGGAVTLRNPRHSLLKLLDMTGLADAFDVASD